jgi:hypothetical protein
MFPTVKMQRTTSPLFGPFKKGDPCHKGQGTDKYIGNNKIVG